MLCSNILHTSRGEHVIGSIAWSGGWKLEEIQLLLHTGNLWHVRAISYSLRLKTGLQTI